MQHPAEELATLRAVFELVRQPTFVVDAHDQRIVAANPAACEALSVAHDELIGRSWSHVSGRLPATTLRDVAGDRRRFVAVAHESAYDRCGMPRDALTGLANRDVLFGRLSLDGDNKPAGRLAMLFIDLDGFKLVNDTWGHIAGDRVLRIVAERLSASVRPSDLVVRYGGDEFVVLVEGARQRRDLERLARRITRGLQKPILLEGHPFIPSASIGIAQRNSRMTAVDALIAEADRAMYRAKMVARNAVISMHAAPIAASA